MRTAVISDLHLGTRSRVDLLRRPDIRARLAGALRGYDQLVLLGDAFELRDRPVRTALDAATPFLAEVGAALGSGRVVLVPGNHDHRLAVEGLELRRPRRGSLGLCHEVRPGRSGALAAIRDRLGTELVLAYPGVRVAPRVWATHGHYLDVHSNAPTLECVATALLATARRRRAGVAADPEDYEALLQPTYDLFHTIAQRARVQRQADAGKRLLRAVETALGTRGPRHGQWAEPAPPPPAPRLAGDREGTAPGELRRPGLLPFARVLERLGVEADHVLFGHTHRTGPLPGDPLGPWTTPEGIRLTNTGSWLDEVAYHAGNGASSPYWPGTLIEVDGAAPPQVHRLLAGVDLGATVRNGHGAP